MNVQFMGKRIRYHETPLSKYLWRSVGTPLLLLYTPRVFRKSTLIISTLCFCLVMVQVSGLHLHTNFEGNGGLHGPHIHAADPEGHDHESETDVSFWEFTIAWVKQIPFLPLFIATVFVFAAFAKQVWVLTTKTFKPCRHTRWRPPLRAPPYPNS